MIKKGWLVSEGKGRGIKYRLKQNVLEGSQVGDQVDDISSRSLDISVSEWHILQSLHEGGTSLPKSYKQSHLKIKL